MLNFLPLLITPAFQLRSAICSIDIPHIISIVYYVAAADSVGFGNVIQMLSNEFVHIEYTIIVSAAGTRHKCP
jgi:hypothetical protein